MARSPQPRRSFESGGPADRSKIGRVWCIPPLGPAAWFTPLCAWAAPRALILPTGTLFTVPGSSLVRCCAAGEATGVIRDRPYLDLEHGRLPGKRRAPQSDGGD
eukprot:585394-Prymnesium_polylepis.3